MTTIHEIMQTFVYVPHLIGRNAAHTRVHPPLTMFLVGHLGARLALVFFLISLPLAVARAAEVTYLVKPVEVLRAGERAWVPLNVGDEVVEGDAIRTGKGGRVEVTLAPKRVFRVSEITEVVLDSMVLREAALSDRFRIILGRFWTAILDPLRAARGESSAEVVAGGLPKSVSRETTFERDLLDWEHIERVLSYLTGRCAYALREQGLEAKRVTLKVRYGDFKTLTFSHTLPEATCIDAVLMAALRLLLPKGKRRRARVRLVGVAMSMLRHNQHQLQLFGGQRAEKWERVLERVDAIRGKWGFQYMHTGNAIRPAHDRRLRCTQGARR